MSISGIGGGSWFTNWGSVKAKGGADATAKPSPLDPLGADLQKGDLAAAQADYATLTGASGRAMNTKDASAFASQLDALGKALDSGDTSSAQAAFQKLTQLLQSSGLHHRHRHHGASGTGSANGTGTSGSDPFAQALDALGQALDSGDVDAAKSAYQKLQDLLQSAPDRKTALPIGMAAPADPTGGIVDLQA